MTDRLYLYDTTLRDGQQTQGVQFSAAEKSEIARMLDDLGVDYIEGGWPGANPTDSEFFATAPKTNATMTAFGMTKRAGRSAENDDVLAAVLDAETGTVCLVGKTHPFQVREALGISLEDNLENIRASIAHLRAKGREAIFDAEHFFDGFADDPDYSTLCLKTALDAGARWVVLCDTNGGTLPSVIQQVTEAVVQAGIPGDKLGVHTHDDTGTAVACTLAAIDGGARHIQGTFNGLGERCGNASLTSLIPTLLLKEPYASTLKTRVTPDSLSRLVQVSRRLDEILNRPSVRSLPYVGASAFAHKAGLHASAIIKNPSTYEHIEPSAVGNMRIIPMSNQAGQSNLRTRLAEAGIEVSRDDPALSRILELVKLREDEGYAYDAAQASFELLARAELGLLPKFFEVERYRVLIERRMNALGHRISVSEAVVVANVAGQRVISASESMNEDGNDRGPVSALWHALAKDLGPYQAAVDEMRLTDFRVRITGAGVDAVTRVTIDSADDKDRMWSTVGVSPNLVDASFEALIDAINWKLLRDGLTPQ